MTNSSTSSNNSNNNNNSGNNNNNSNHHHHHHHHRISNGTQACAACKYQRRKCAPDCVLAPYFPHDRQRQFLNAHKLFGVSNITKIIRNLNPPDKDIAMRTIMYQSDARAKDPVGGCFRIIRDLHHQIEYCKAELDLVLQQLAICKAQQAYHHHHQAQAQTQTQTQTQTQVQFMQPIACAPAPPPPPPPQAVALHQHRQDQQHPPVGPATGDQHQHLQATDQGDVIQATDPLSDPNDYQDQYQALMRCYYDDQQDNQSDQQEYNVQVLNHQQQQQQQQQQQDQDEAQPHHGLQYSWGGAVEDAVLATSNSSTNNNNNNNNHQYMMIRGDHLVRPDDQDQCGIEGFQVVKQPQIMHQMNNIAAVCASSYNDETDFGSKFDDPHVDVSCSTDIHRDNGLNSFDPQQSTELSEELLLKENHKVILEHQEDESFYHHIPEHDLRSAATLFTLN